jgi:hypothetical protein
MASLIVISTLLSPRSVVDADVYKQSAPLWSSMTKEAEISTLDLDYQKALDLFKFNPKDVFEEKELTTQLTIWYYLTEDMELGDIQAAGIFGNMMVESGSRTFNVRPGIYSPCNAYYGLCQWNTTGHHRDINGGTLDEQLEYLSDTIENEMGSSNYQRFLNATTPEEASIIFGQWYERCGSPRSRQNEARQAYERFSR